MAEYVMGYILACERHHRQYYENQKKKIWEVNWQVNFEILLWWKKERNTDRICLKPADLNLFSVEV